jgi:hypothetical protein
MTACILCARDLAGTEIQTCVRCLGRVRSGLVRVERLFALLPAMLTDMSGSGLTVLVRGEDLHGLPAEDVLVMLGPGSPSGSGHPSDPPAVAFELAWWARDWAEVRGEASGLPVSVPQSVAWLSQRAGWAAAHHPAFDEFASDVRRIMLRLEDVTAMSERPETGPPCPYCRASLLREFTDRGLADDWLCPRCRRAFGPAQYLLAVRAALEAETERMQA